MMLYGQAITTVPITFTSTPTGSGFITINGSAETAPYTIAAANIGDTYTIVALSPVSIGGYNYTFSSWNDSGSQTHTITVSTATTYTASYTQQWGGGIAQVLGPFYGNSTSSSTVTDTLGSMPFNNTLLVLTFGSHDNSFTYATVSSISETGNSWQQLEQNKTNYYDSEIWATNYTSGASLTVTINLSVSNGQAEAIICGYQGVNYFDRSASNIGFGNTNQVTGITLQTTQANELCVGTIDTSSGSGQSTPQNSFTMYGGDVYSTNSMSFLQNIVSLEGTYSTGTTSNASYAYAGGIVTFASSTVVYPPTFSNIAVSQTTDQSILPTNFSCQVSCAPNGLSGFIFGSNDTDGVWTNTTWASLSGSASWANESQFVNVNMGNNVVVGFEWWANNTINGWANSGMQTFTPTNQGINYVYTDSPVNNGFEMNVQTINEGYSQSTVYVLENEATSNGIWTQFGYGCTSGNTLYPVISLTNMFASGVQAGYFCFNGNPINATFTNWSGPLTFVNGTTHDFKVVFVSNSTMNFYLDNQLVLVLTVSQVQAIENAAYGANDISSFSNQTEISNNQLTYYNEIDNGNMTTNLDAPIAVAYLQNNGWTIPTVLNSFATEGFEGQIQNPALAYGEVYTNTSYSLASNTALYSGSAVIFGSSFLYYFPDNSYVNFPGVNNVSPVTQMPGSNATYPNFWFFGNYGIYANDMNVTLTNLFGSDTLTFSAYSATATNGTVEIYVGNYSSPTYILGQAYNLASAWNNQTGILTLTVQNDSAVTACFNRVWGNLYISEVDSSMTSLSWSGQAFTIQTQGQGGIINVFTGSRNAPQSYSGISSETYNQVTDTLSGIYGPNGQIVLDWTAAPGSQPTPTPLPNVTPAPNSPGEITLSSQNFGSVSPGQKTTETIKMTFGESIQVTSVSFSGSLSSWLKTSTALPQTFNVGNGLISLVLTVPNGTIAKTYSGSVIISGLDPFGTVVQASGPISFTVLGNGKTSAANSINPLLIYVLAAIIIVIFVAFAVSTLNRKYSFF
jgi:hypothetical protein